MPYPGLWWLDILFGLCRQVHVLVSLFFTLMQPLCSVSCRGRSCAGTLYKAHRLLFSSSGERLVSELEVWSQIPADPNCCWGKCNISACWEPCLGCCPHSWCCTAHVHCPHTPPIKIQLNRKHFLEAFEIKTVLNFGWFSAFFSSSVHLILRYFINLCVFTYGAKLKEKIPQLLFHFGLFLRLKNHSSMSFQWNNFEIKIVKDQVVIKFSCSFFLFWLKSLNWSCWLVEWEGWEPHTLRHWIWDYTKWKLN